MMFASARAGKAAQVTDSLRRQATRRSDQAAVWDSVARKAAALDASSPSEAMRDVYERVSGDVSSYRAAFRALPRQVGAVFAIDGRAVGLELFDAQATFASALGKLVASYALDAVERRGPPRGAVPPGVARDFLRRVASARSTEVPGVGEGTELRLEGPGLAGVALVAGGLVVHVAALEHRASGGEDPGEAPEGAGGPPRRRRVAG
jgi:hypothetical protein